MKPTDRFCDTPGCDEPASAFILDNLVTTAACKNHSVLLSEKGLTLCRIEDYDYMILNEEQARATAAQYAERAKAEYTKRHFQKALELWKWSLYLFTLRFPQDRETAKVGFELGKALYEQLNRFQEAKEALQRSLEIELKHDPASEETAEVLNVLGCWLFINKCNDEAKQVLTQAVQLGREHRSHSESTYKSLCFLSWVHRETLETEVALKMLEECRVEGLQHFPTSETMAHVFASQALIYKESDQNDLAEETYLQALTIVERCFPTAFFTAAYLSEAGNNYLITGQYEEAELRFKQSLLILSSYYPGAYWLIDRVTSSLYNVYRNTNQYAEAEYCCSKYRRTNGFRAILMRILYGN